MMTKFMTMHRRMTRIALTGACLAVIIWAATPSRSLGEPRPTTQTSSSISTQPRDCPATVWETIQLISNGMQILSITHGMEADGCSDDLIFVYKVRMQFPLGPGVALITPDGDLLSIDEPFPATLVGHGIRSEAMKEAGKAEVRFRRITICRIRASWTDRDLQMDLGSEFVPGVPHEAP